jgi:hypothetical protein
VVQTPLAENDKVIERFDADCLDHALDERGQVRRGVYVTGNRS